MYGSSGLSILVMFQFRIHWKRYPSESWKSACIFGSSDLPQSRLTISSISNNNQLKNDVMSRMPNVHKIRLVLEWPNYVKGCVCVVHLRINRRMRSWAPDRIYMKFDHFLINNQSNNELLSPRPDIYDFGYLLIKNRLKNELLSPRPDIHYMFLWCVLKQIIVVSVNTWIHAVNTTWGLFVKQHIKAMVWLTFQETNQTSHKHIRLLLL